MSVKTFLDSNIVIYCYTSTEPEKRAIALDLAEGDEVYISTQVLQETANTLRKKFEKPWEEIGRVLDEISQNFEVYENSSATIKNAVRIAERYGFSLYDSLILASALQVGCHTVFSEDMQDGQLIDGTLTIRSPFH